MFLAGSFCVLRQNGKPAYSYFGGMERNNGAYIAAQKTAVKRLEDQKAAAAHHFCSVCFDDLVRCLAFLTPVEVAGAAASCRLLREIHNLDKNLALSRGLLSSLWEHVSGAAWVQPGILLNNSRADLMRWDMTTHVHWLPGGAASRGTYLVLNPAGALVVKPGSVSVCLSCALPSPPGAHAYTGTQ